MNGLGQIAAEATLDDLPYYRANFRKIIATREGLSRELVNLGFAYQLKPSVSLTCDIINLFNAGQLSYRGVTNRLENFLYTGTTISLGVSGRF